jgi:hydroxypyruvate isomerase
MPFLKLCHELKRIGYTGLELLPEGHWDFAKAQGLAIVTHGAHDGIVNGLNRIENHSRVAAEITTAIDKAAAAGVLNLVCFSGNRAGLDDATGLANTVAGLKLVAGYAELKGVTLLLELLNSKVDHKDYQCDHAAWGFEAIRRVGSIRVKLLYDIYHAQIMEGDLIRTIVPNIDMIGHFHTAGVPGRHEIGAAQEINYPAVVHAIAGTTYFGWVGQEFVPTGDPIAALEEAYRICNVG